MENGRKRLADQLALALSKLPEGIRRKDVADKAHSTQAALSQWASGKRSVDPHAIRLIAKYLHNPKLVYSAAREEYGVLSFKNDGKVKDDLFAATIDQKKQEQERLSVQVEAFVSAAKPEKQRTSKDWENIKRMDKEFLEEISSEWRMWFDWCDYVGEDAMEIIEEMNKKIGG